MKGVQRDGWQDRLAAGEWTPVPGLRACSVGRSRGADRAERDESVVGDRCGRCRRDVHVASACESADGGSTVRATSTSQACRAACAGCWSGADCHGLCAEPVAVWRRHRSLHENRFDRLRQRLHDSSDDSEDRRLRSPLAQRIAVGRRDRHRAIHPWPHLERGDLRGIMAAGFVGALAASLAIYAPSFLMLLFVAQAYQRLRHLDWIRGPWAACSRPSSAC